MSLYLRRLLDLAEDEDQTTFLEEALDNLAFTDDMDRFDLLALDADEPDDIWIWKNNLRWGKMRRFVFIIVMTVLIRFAPAGSGPVRNRSDRYRGV